MISSIKRQVAARSVEEQAAYWFSVLSSENATQADERAFDLWRAESPAHGQAYERLTAAWDALGGVADDREILDLRRRALRMDAGTLRGRFRALAMFAAAAVLALVVGVALWQNLIPGVGDSAGISTLAGRGASGKPVVLETATGERSTVSLADGSTVELNTETKLRTHFTAERREIFLLNGQAVFEVAKDPARPFVVYAAGKRITAIGTQFDVRVHEEKIAVTLLEGRVTVDEARAGSEPSSSPGFSPIELQPGEQLLVSARSAPIVREADVARVTSWRYGRVEFENEALATAVDEINRYSVRKVVLADPELADLRISGSFRAGSVDNFVTALGKLYPIEAVPGRHPEEIRLVWKQRVAAQ